MNNSLIQLILIRFKEFIREPGIIFWSLIFPISMAWVLGIAFNKQNELVQDVAVVQQAGTQNADLKAFLVNAENSTGEQGQKALRRTLENNKLGKTIYNFVFTTWDKAMLMLKRGETLLVIESTPDSLLYHFDPHNQDAKLSYIQLSAAIQHEEPVYQTAAIKPLTSVGTRYIDFLIPGLIALGIMNSLMWGISYALIDMRVKKLLRRMVASPMKKSYFLISHFVARLALSILESAILFFFAKYYFDIKVMGSMWALALVFLAGNITFTGIAILVAARVSNSRVGNGLMNIIILPMTILSGIFFSYHNFPDFMIPFIQKLPLTMLADSMRSVFIEGAGIAQVMNNTLVLLAIGFVTFFAGLKIYKWY